MKIFFILVALLHLCDTSSGCNSELQRDWDFPGSDNQILFSPDAEHCQHLCTQQASCLFWAFIGPDCKADNSACLHFGPLQPQTVTAGTSHNLDQADKAEKLSQWVQQ
ncbi:hypothetical protein AMECASPLE_030012 [Ameca splendens]|uniref:Apple domain-containing protein n=1 Tax=Ameca splendens TaxID=208324 RepID=A0ABV0ZF45_9TELE